MGLNSEYMVYTIIIIIRPTVTVHAITEQSKRQNILEHLIGLYTDRGRSWSLQASILDIKCWRICSNFEIWYLISQQYLEGKGITALSIFTFLQSYEI